MLGGHHLLFGLFLPALASALQILQLTDLHWDQGYDVNRGIPPSQGGMCRVNESVPGPRHRLGAYGTYGCDSPRLLIDHSLAEMKRLVPSPDFIVWNGDSMPHVPNSAYNEDKVIAELTNLTLSIRRHYPNAPLYPVFGNHDYWRSGAFPGRTSKIYKAMAKLWAPLVRSNESSLASAGYYSAQPVDGLLLLGLNTNLYFHYDPLSEVELGSDPGGQLAWLRSKCDKARAASQKVLINAHVPPGWDGYTVMKPTYNAAYLDALLHCADVLTPGLYGHEHADRWMLLKTAKEQSVGAFLMAPSILPEKSNPAFRSLQLDPSSFAFGNIRTYFLNLTEANRSGGNRSFQLEYEFRQAYGIAGSVDATSLADLWSRMKANSSLLQRYYRNVRVQHPKPQLCDRACRQEQLCRIAYADFPRYRACSSANSIFSIPSSTWIPLLVSSFLHLI